MGGTGRRHRSGRRRAPFGCRPMDGRMGLATLDLGATGQRQRSWEEAHISGPSADAECFRFERAGPVALAGDDAVP
eukprot:6579542-Prymnesium_polylepis.1